MLPRPPTAMMIALAICFAFVHQTASAPQVYVPQVESSFPQWGEYAPPENFSPYGQPRGYPSPSFMQPLNPWSRPSSPLLIDSKLLALYNIIKCMEQTGDLKKCAEALAHCDELFKKKKPEEDDEEEEQKKKKKKRKPKTTTTTTTEEPDEDEDAEEVEK